MEALAFCRASTAEFTDAAFAALRRPRSPMLDDVVIAGVESPSIENMAVSLRLPPPSDDSDDDDMGSVLIHVDAYSQMFCVPVMTRSSFRT